MRNIVFLFTLLFLCAQASTQARPEIEQRLPGVQTQQTLSPSQAIERHFESAHPVTRSNLQGAVPGAQLIAAHNARAAALARLRQITGIPSPLAASASPILPGLEMRPALPAGSYPTAVVTGDFNRDGHQDFVVANGNGNDLWICFGKGDGTFELPRIVPLTKGLSPVFMVAADLRGNGILDLVVAEFGSSSVGVLMGKGDGTFEVEQEYALPETPGALAVADFNHDGKQDIAAAMTTSLSPASVNPGPPYIAMLAGNGDGTLTNPVITYNWGFTSTVFDLDAADVNGDGLPDLLITGPSLDNSTIYLNNGDGTFREGTVVVENAEFNTAVGGRLADVNGDGCPDAAVADVSGVIWVRLGDCAGGFAALTSVATGQANAGVRVADVNGDGHPDLIASSVVAEEPNFQSTAGNTVSVALGDGKGNFSFARVYGGSSEAESLAVGDFKGDGRPSIVTADIDTDTATVFPNDGNGGYGFPQGTYACQTNTGTQVCPYIVAGFGSGYTFADLNGDGKPDMFEIGFDSSSHYFTLSFINDGSGRFGASRASPLDTSNTITQLGDYKLGDFRHTGHLDLVGLGSNSAYLSTQQLIVFQPGNGDGTFGKPTITPVSGADGSMATGDFDRDGKLDFVAVNGSKSHTLTTFLGNDDGTFRTGASLQFSDTNNDIARVFASDFNRDGKLDILVFATSNGYGTTGSAVWEFDGNGDGTFQPGRELFNAFQPMTLVDINNDGHPDIVRLDFFQPDGILVQPTPLITNYLGQADGTFQQVSSYSPYIGAPVDPQPYLQLGDPLTVSTTGDYNGDGKIDEVAFEYQTGLPIYAQMLMGNGDGTFTTTYDIFPFVPFLYPIDEYDLNGDGFADMVSLDLGTGGMMLERGAAAPALQMALTNQFLTTSSGCGMIYPNLISSAGRSVSLSSSVQGVVLPGSITIAAGATSAMFCFSLDGTYDPHQVFDITATMAGDSATAWGAQAYLAPFEAAITPSTTTPVYAGQDTPPVTVTVQSQAQYAGGIVHFTCASLPKGYNCEFNPAQATLATASSVSTTLVVHTAAGTPASSAFPMIADDGLTLQRVWLTLNVAVLGFSQAPASFYGLTGGTGTESFGVTGIPPYAFSCTGLPAGATCSFAGTQVTYPNVSGMGDTIAIPAGTAAGSFPFTLNVSSDGVTTSMSQTLNVYTFALQAPSADQDWAIPGTSLTLSFPVQQSNLPSGGVLVQCSLDSATLCPGAYSSLSPSTSTLTEQVLIPLSTSLGQHQLNLTTTFFGNVQQFSFPFYVADFSGSVSPSAVTLTAGGTSSVTVNLTATTGFLGKVSLSCGTSAITCNFSQGTVALTGGTTQQVTLTLGASATAMRTAPPRPPSRTGRLPDLALLAVVVPLGVAIGLRRRKVGYATLSAVALLSLISCGGGSVSGGATPPQPNQYSVTVQGICNGITHTLVTINVAVNH